MNPTLNYFEIRPKLSNLLRQKAHEYITMGLALGPCGLKKRYAFRLTINIFWVEFLVGVTVGHH